ncbi:MAG: hypothetical protein J1F02_06850 [Lachnospiraceae bacterium]|nr:hypothetical protein [Lachnospiraceae bacterium]
MKMVRKDKPIHTIPDGVWESSSADRPENKTETEHLREISTDAQGNGYTGADDPAITGSHTPEK